jgi:hypothetical protein
MTRDYRDRVIEQFAVDEVLLLERIDSLTGDLSIYRQMVSAALTACHDLTVRCDQLRASLRRTEEQYRALRVQLLDPPAAA